jgi:hypothetical protein
MADWGLVKVKGLQTNNDVNYNSVGNYSALVQTDQHPSASVGNNADAPRDKKFLLVPDLMRMLYHDIAVIFVTPGG